MSRRSNILEEFERDLAARDSLTHEKKLRIYEAMWKEAVSLGMLPPKDPLEGIEVDIKIARILNSISRARRTRRTE
jgi:hypothetical protein